MSESPPTTPVCYRHPGRETYVRCTRCDRPICPDCMRDASVGHQCPECVAEGRRSARPARTAFGGGAAGRHGYVTKALIALNVLLMLLSIASDRGGDAAVGGSGFGGLMGGSTPLTEWGCGARPARSIPDGTLGGIADGEWYRLVTAMFLHYGVLHLLLNMWALWVLGRSLEANLGPLRFAALYLIAGLGGNVAAYLFSAAEPATAGASTADLRPLRRADHHRTQDGLGTTISPYLFFWQAAQEVEEERAMGRNLARRRGATREELAACRLDVFAGMFASNAIMYFIIATTAATLHAHGQMSIATAQQAAEALRPLAGAGAYWLFTIGLIGTGMLAVPVLAGSCAYAIAEAAAWRGSLNQRPPRAKKFYIVLGVAVALGVVLTYAGFNAIKMLFASAVINGVLAPPLILLVLLLTRDREVMGDAVSSRPLAFFGWTAFAVMMIAAIGLFIAA